MPYDGIVLYSVKTELETLILNKKIEKVYQPQEDEIILNLRNSKEEHYLLISANPNSPRVHLTNMSKHNPISPPVFCMVLRKHLTGGRIVGFFQPELERILHINIETVDELGIVKTKTLIVEIMGKHSNIILIDPENNKIIDGIKRIPESVNTYRQIFPGNTYKEPPHQGKKNPFARVDFEFYDIFKTAHPDSKAFKVILDNYMGISPAMAKHIVLKADLDDDTLCSHLKDSDLINLWNAFDATFKSIQSSSFKPVVFLDENRNRFVDFYIFPLIQYDFYHKKEIESVNEALDYFYCVKLERERFNNKKNNLLKIVEGFLEKCYKKLELYRQKSREAKDSEKYRIYGELIISNIHNIKKGLDKICVKNFYDTHPSIVCINLDPTISPAQNAQLYFKKYSKLKKAAEIIKKRIAKTEEEIKYLDGILVSLENTVQEEDIDEIRHELERLGYIKKKKDKKEKHSGQLKKGTPMKYMSTEGFEILVGKNNRQNDYLTMVFACSEDLWLHTKNIPGSHVIIKSAGRRIPDKTIIEAANLAAFYSKAKYSSNVPVDYTEKKNVRKPKGAKPGMVIYDNFKTIYVTPSPDIIEKLKKS